MVWLALAAVKVGLSPRVRGNLSGFLRRGRIDRSIPACAGEPPTSRLGELWPHRPVYPRVCGGTSAGFDAQDFAHSSRSIPACAGEPGATSRLMTSTECVGLSPRVRGNPALPLGTSY